MLLLCGSARRLRGAELGEDVARRRVRCGTRALRVVALLFEVTSVARGSQIVEAALLLRHRRLAPADFEVLLLGILRTLRCGAVPRPQLRRLLLARVVRRLQRSHLRFALRGVHFRRGDVALVIAVALDDEAIKHAFVAEV